MYLQKKIYIQSVVIYLDKLNQISEITIYVEY